MIQGTTAFDAVAPGLRLGVRYTLAIIGAVVLGAVATALAYQVNNADPPAPGHQV